MGVASARTSVEWQEGSKSRIPRGLEGWLQPLRRGGVRSDRPRSNRGPGYREVRVLIVLRSPRKSYWKLRYAGVSELAGRVWIGKCRGTGGGGGSGQGVRR